MTGKRVSWTLLLLGLAGLSTGGAIAWRLPSAQATDLAEQAVAALRAEVAELEALPAGAGDAHADALPPSLSLEQVLGFLDSAARAAELRSIRLTAQAAGAAEAEDGEEPDRQDDRPPAASPPAALAPAAITCAVQVEAEFASLTRFLALLERARPVMRVRALDVTPQARGLRGSLTLVAYYHPAAEEAQ